nr:MAG TPA: hypothetical protein [Caudoviricetes sp.]
MGLTIKSRNRIIRQSMYMITFFHISITSFRKVSAP